MITTEREFSKACKQHGFSRLGPRKYVRIYGDGIYQTISTGTREYIYFSSPYYSSEQRKSYRIAIGIRSMYWGWPEIFFQEGPACGYSPYALVNRSKDNTPFLGIWPEYEIMEKDGFDALDSISTQEALLSLYTSVETVSDGGRIYNLCLVAPFFLTGNIREAEIEISRHFIQSSEALRYNRLHMQQNNIPWDENYEKRVNLALDEDRMLWHMCMSRNYKKMEQYLEENYLRNIVWAKRSGIVIHPEHRQRHMPG